MGKTNHMASSLPRPSWQAIAVSLRQGLAWPGPQIPSARMSAARRQFADFQPSLAGFRRIGVLAVESRILIIRLLKNLRLA